MKVFVVLSVLFSLALADPFQWKSCAPTSDSISIRKIEISPDPLVFPGKVSYDVEVEVKKPLKDVSMSLKIVRNTFFLDVTLPCVKQIGSCSYSKMCSFVQDMVAENWGDIGRTIGSQILDQENVNVNLCETGMQPQVISKKGTLEIPKLPSLLKFVAAGDYSIHLEVKSNADQSMLACLDVQAELTGNSIWGRKRRSD